MEEWARWQAAAAARGELVCLEEEARHTHRNRRPSCPGPFSHSRRATSAVTCCVGAREALETYCRVLSCAVHAQLGVVAVLTSVSIVEKKYSARHGGEKNERALM